MALRKIPLRRAGNRVIEFLGGDRELVMVSGLMAATLVFVAMSVIAAVFGVVLWIFALWALRKMAKADPQMRKVYQRSLRYANYYPPRATPFRLNTPAQGRQYK
ncbi:conjugal transfer protein TrbD [Pandoraea apista]|uniref:conjugal transfer protein TrbD n=1 Tax=Pandoraea apista TaxID=93218 RepID=UPI000657893C|nr:conjugal transfer protein TrbD [Pandoraea apista]ALS68406.1 conjugal transfer protein TrbD [Pandoraea apista]CFB60429.1 Type IV secretory pathway, VirB3-like protein [Pandoraea apista]